MPTTSNDSSLFQEFLMGYSIHVPQQRRASIPEPFYRDRFEFVRHHNQKTKVNIGHQTQQVERSYIEVIAPYSRFTVENIIDYFERNEIRIEFIVHCVFAVERNEVGDLLHMHRASISNNRENWIYIEIPIISDTELKKIYTDLSNINEHLHLLVSDFHIMRQHLNDLKFSEQSDHELLLWILDNFIFLGMITNSHEYLGIYRKPETVLELKNIAVDFLQKSKQIGITFQEASVRIELDKQKHIYIANFHTKHKTISLTGFFAQRGEISWKKSIPKINTLLNQLYQKLQLTSFSHFARQIDVIAQELPVSLFFTRQHLLLPFFQEILQRVYDNHLEVITIEDTQYNSLWMLMFVPEVYEKNIPKRQFVNFINNANISIEYEFQVRINHLNILWVNLKSQYNLQELKQLIEQKQSKFLYSWEYQFQKILADASHCSTKERHIHKMSAEYLQRFSSNYSKYYSPLEAYNHITAFENWDQSKNLLACVVNSPEGVSKINIYSLTKLNAMKLIPVLENYGFEIDQLVKSEITLKAKDKSGYIYTFNLVANESAFTNPTDAHRIASAINNSLFYNPESEIIDSFVVTLSLTYQQVDLLKAWVAYLVQIDKSHTKFSLHDFLWRHPDFTKYLLELFAAKHDDVKDFDEAHWESQEVIALKELSSSGAQVHANNFICLVKAIVRSNYYLPKRKAIALKIKTQELPALQNNAAIFDIFVYAYDWEGIHIRFGKVARGGIRWSDRIDDYRTEIADLAQAQTSKNTIIVPTGGKGGFVIKRVNHKQISREDWFTLGKRVYSDFISSVLSLTDNRDETGKIIPAANAAIKRWDDDDSYLVVAADKGTASFSDIANEISQKHEYWLGDAFASGGSKGYNHKEQGITARGSWVSFLHHARELGIDSAKQTIRVIGIGDMSGDVFGNGLLLDKNIHLLGAFNHQYIFFDPIAKNDQAAITKAYAERKRLFVEATNWQHYNQDLIAEGGGVFSRQELSITLTPYTRELLATDETNVSGEQFIQLLLKAPVELIFNGGIGTYIKSSQENHYQTHDVNNDRVRIDACDLRARIIVEGGNLGMTPIARLEAAKHGVALNTDFIDNSAGVNMSDHEVNLKILISVLDQQSGFQMEQRDSYIHKLSQQQIQMVTSYNERINLALSLEEMRSTKQFIAYRSLIKFLNRNGYFTRGENAIPFESELDELQKQDEQLSRPILCTLLCYAKLHCRNSGLQESPLFDDIWYERYLYNYFPLETSKQYNQYLSRHPLKKEIILAEVINDVVHSAGMTYLQTMALRYSKSYAQIIDTYIRLSTFLNLHWLRNLPKWKNKHEYLHHYYTFLLILEDQVAQINRLCLENQGFQSLYQEEHFEKFQTIYQECLHYCNHPISKTNYNLPTPEIKSDLKIILDDFAKIEVLGDAFQIITLAQYWNKHISVRDYYAISQKFSLYQLRQMITTLPNDNEWEVLFCARVENSLRKIVFFYIELYLTNAHKAVDNDIVTTIDAVVRQYEKNSAPISAAMLYETFSHLIRLIQSHTKLNKHKSHSP